MDVQLHAGPCEDLSAFNVFTKNLILENVRLTNYGTDDLGALAPDENAKVDETGDISAEEIYEIMQLNLTRRGDAIVDVEVVDVVRCDMISCGECQTQSDGCEKWYALAGAIPASPGTVPEIYFSLDSGKTWDNDDVDSCANIADALACLGKYVVVVSNADAAHHYALKSEFDDGSDPTFTQITAGYVAAGPPNDISSNGMFAFVVGDAGYIYALPDATGGVTVLDAGVATSSNLNAVDILSEEIAVAVGDLGAIVYTEDGITWQSVVNSPVGLGANYLCVDVKSADEWWIGSDDGRLFYTLDRGLHWTESAFPGAATEVNAIEFSTKSIGYLAIKVGGSGRLLRTFNGGYDWITLPEGVGVIPAQHGLNAIATCPYDPDIVVAVGLATDDSDGIIIVGDN